MTAQTRTPLTLRQMFLLRVAHRGRLERRVWQSDGVVQWWVASVVNVGQAQLVTGEVEPLADAGLFTPGDQLPHGPLQSDAHRWELTDKGRDALNDGWYQ